MNKNQKIAVGRLRFMQRLIEERGCTVPGSILTKLGNITKEIQYQPQELGD